MLNYPLRFIVLSLWLRSFSTSLVSAGRETGAFVGCEAVCSLDSLFSAFSELESAMETSENKKRVLDLLWKNYQDQIVSSRRFGDRVTIVVGATVGAFGLVVKLNEGNTLNSNWSLGFVLFALAALSGAFVCAAMVWRPKIGEQPTGTDVDRIWQYLVAVEDDVSAATLMADICKATDAEHKATSHLATWFIRCMVCCGLTLVSVIVSEVIS